jgi:hypothetical protein
VTRKMTGMKGMKVTELLGSDLQLTCRIDLKVETQQKGRFCGFTECKCESLRLQTELESEPRT